MRYKFGKYCEFTKLPVLECQHGVCSSIEARSIGHYGSSYNMVLMSERKKRVHLHQETLRGEDTISDLILSRTGQ